MLLANDLLDGYSRLAQWQQWDEAELQATRYPSQGHKTSGPGSYVVEMSAMGRGGHDASGWPQMLELLAATPALIYDQHLNVIASNRIAVALAAGFHVGANLARSTFLTATVDVGVEDGPLTGAQVAAILRDALGRHPEDGEFIDLVGELALGSDNFSRSWADSQSLEDKGDSVFVLEGGEQLALPYSLVSLNEPVGHTLILWHPANQRTRAILREIDTGPAGGGQRTHC